MPRQPARPLKQKRRKERRPRARSAKCDDTQAKLAALGLQALGKKLGLLAILSADDMAKLFEVLRHATGRVEGETV